MNDAAHGQLEAVLDRELEVARSLAATLDAERIALTGTSPAEVLAKAADKTALFARLEQLDLERRQVCDATGISLPLGSRGPTAGIAGTLADRWQALLGLIAGCKAANEVNGYIIHARRGQLEQLFQVLRGSGPVTYGRHGKNFLSSPRALARA
jgi:flagellar biosynthesis/type III secretory pathway chaperone